MAEDGEPDLPPPPAPAAPASAEPLDVPAPTAKREVTS